MVWIRVLLILVIATVVSAQQYNIPFSPPAAGGGSALTAAAITLSDDFETDTSTNWDEYGKGSATCTVASGELTLSTDGICNNNTNQAPTTGTDKGEFAYWEFTAAGGGTFAGAAFRHATDAALSNGDPNYAMRCETGGFVLRECDWGIECRTFHTGEACDSGSGDAGAVMIAGTGNDTEFCMWTWDATTPSTKDPDDWKDATECVHVSGGSIALLANYSDCGTGTVCGAWDGTPNAFVDISTDLGISIYGGSGSEVFEDWAHGSVQ